MHAGPLSCVPRQISVVSAACFVGVFVFIARSSHATERPPLLVTFDRTSGVSGCYRIMVARRWVIRHPMMHLRGRLGGTYMICRVCCVFLVGSFVTFMHSSHAAERPPLLVTFGRTSGVSGVLLVFWWRVAG